jgi:benzil reductase ((S)-benzoin forming)
VSLGSGDQLALVTGTSSGIGAAIADILLKEGWTVVGMSRTPADFDNPRYQHVQVDLGKLELLTEIADNKLKPIVEDGRWQRTGLVNNAGAVGALRPMEKTDPLQLARVLAVNTVAPVFLMGFVVRVAPPATPLRIVNVSTGAAVRPLPGLADYGSSKAALRMAGMTLAAELKSDDRPGGARANVAILSYEPGIVDTAMQEEVRSPQSPWNQRFLEFYEQGKLEPPEAPARDVVDFLGSDGGEPFEERRFGVS